MKTSTWFQLLFLPLLLNIPSSQASLIGDDISSVFIALEQTAPRSNLWDDSFLTPETTPIAATVGAGNEYFSDFGLGDHIFADFDADTLLIGVDFGSFDNIGSTSIFDFSGLDWSGGNGRIIGLNIISSDFSGVVRSFGDHSIHIELANQVFSFPSTQTIRLQILTGVPAPGIIWLFGAALAGLIRIHRLNRKPPLRY